MDLKKIQLIGVGWVPAVSVSELKAGDKLMWNYGHTSTVVSCETKNGTTYELAEKSDHGAEYSRRKRGTTLVCRVPNGKA